MQLELFPSEVIYAGYNHRMYVFGFKFKDEFAWVFECWISPIRDIFREAAPLEFSGLQEKIYRAEFFSHEFICIARTWERLKEVGPFKTTSAPVGLDITFNPWRHGR